MPASEKLDGATLKVANHLVDCARILAYLSHDGLALEKHVKVFVDPALLLGPGGRRIFGWTDLFEGLG